MVTRGKQVDLALDRPSTVAITSATTNDVTEDPGARFLVEVPVAPAADPGLLTGAGVAKCLVEF